VIFVRNAPSIILVTFLFSAAVFGSSGYDPSIIPADDTLKTRAEPIPWLFVIGVPPSESVPGTSTAVNDAKSVLSAMEHQFHIGDDHTIALIGESATMENIRQGFERLIAETAPEDNVFFFYSGQTMSVQLSGTTESVFILPHAGQGEALFQNAVAVDKINEWANSIKANRMMMVYNACFGRADESTPPSRRTIPKELRIRNVFVAGEAKQQQYNSRRNGESLFAYYMVEALKNLSADSDKNNILTAYELSEFVSSKVKIESRRTQMPYTLGMGLPRSPHFIFSGPARKFVSKTIVSQQQNIRVFQDSVYLGTTPLTIALDGDSVRYRLTGEGFMDQFLDVTAAMPQDVFMVNMVPSGRIRVVTDPPGATVIVHDSAYGITPLFIPKMPTGLYLITLRNQYFQDIVKEAEVTASELIVIDEHMVKKQGTITLTGLRGDADVELKSAKFTERLSGLPVLKHPVDQGEYQLTVSKPGYSAFTASISVTSPDISLPVRMEGKSRNTSRIAAFILPGTGQLYMERPVVGWGLLAGFILSSTEAYRSFSRYDTERESYLQYQRLYASSVTLSELNERYARMNSTYASMNSQRDRMFIFSGIAGAFYVLGVIDAFLFEPEPLLPTDDLSLGIDRNSFRFRYTW
jgi:hypothetical protein